MKIEEFLNPRSMSTPAGCGGIVVFITNALVMNFSLSAIWTALTLSGLLGMLVLYAKNISFTEKAIHYVINTLLIFSFATGANQGVNKATQPQVAHASTNPDTNFYIEPNEPVARTIESLSNLDKAIASVQNNDNSVTKANLASVQHSVNELAIKLKSIDSNILGEDVERVQVTGSRVEKKFFSDWLK